METGDPLVDEVRRRRRELVAQHGGLQGWGAYLRKCQQEHPEKVIPAPKRVHTPPQR